MATKRELEVENDDLIDENNSLKTGLADIKEQIEAIIAENSDDDDSDDDSEDDSEEDSE